MNLKIVTAPSSPVIKVEQVRDIHCPADDVYLVPEGFSMTTVGGLQRQIEQWKHKAESRLKGLNYWKAKSK